MTATTVTALAAIGVFFFFALRGRFRQIELPTTQTPRPITPLEFEDILELFLWDLEEDLLPQRPATVPLVNIPDCLRWERLEEFLDRVNVFGSTHGFSAEYSADGDGRLYLNMSYDATQYM